MVEDNLPMSRCQNLGHDKVPQSCHMFCICNDLIPNFRLILSKLYFIFFVKHNLQNFIEIYNFYRKSIQIIISALLNEFSLSEHISVYNQCLYQLTEYYLYPRNSFKPLPILMVNIILISNTLDYFLLF